MRITFYAIRISEDDEISNLAFVAGARSEHHMDALCGANTYYGRFTYDGKVSFGRKLFHEHEPNYKKFGKGKFRNIPIT